MKEKISIFWFRRDLRLEDNHGLHMALQSKEKVLPLFIFDTEITDELPKNDARIGFIYDNLVSISNQLQPYSSNVYCKKGSAIEVWENLISEFNIHAVYTNEDYEPYAIQRDERIGQLLSKNNIQFNLFKDQVIFAKNEVTKNDGKPYTIYTPYKNKWLEILKNNPIKKYTHSNYKNFIKSTYTFPSFASLNFERSAQKVKAYQINKLENYDATRNFPAQDSTSNLSPHLRFGTISVRQIISQIETNTAFLNELIWREFFMQILFHFPGVISNNYSKKYDQIVWRNHPEEFTKWKNGETGYPFVDAGMRELNKTGYMHNRVRMVVASFLCKHLLIDWRWGEAYFAEKLLDYELSSNNGNWQWAAGTGCDAAPYFRVFNPSEQVKRFDPNFEYIKKWVPELNTLNYTLPMVEHKFARERAINTYKVGLQQSIMSAS